MTLSETPAFTNQQQCRGRPTELTTLPLAAQSGRLDRY